MTARDEVADLWDDVLERWIDGRDHLIDPLNEWLSSYQGTGKGKVDLTCYPDPYVGDLRGDTYDPRLVVLGLNPGRGHLELQGRDGVGPSALPMSATATASSEAPPKILRRGSGSTGSRVPTGGTSSRSARDGSTTPTSACTGS